MNVAVVGAGYVGLTTGVALAYLGHEVTCLDSNEARIADLRQGRLPIYEPHLRELALLTEGRLRFSSDPAEAIPDAEVVFLAVGTPPLADGSPDLSCLRSAAADVGTHLGRRFTVVVNKSTVPIGSGNWVECLMAEASNGRRISNDFSVASNPEFLREGSALFDSLYPDRIVLGADDARAVRQLHALYRPIVEQTFTPPSFLPRPEGCSAVPLIATNLASSELIKYTANSFLSLKISFINEIAQLSEKVGADILQIAKAVGLDARIGSRFLQAGIGWGGSCFGKDTAALIATGREYGIAMPIVAAAREVNYVQRERAIEKLLAELKILKGRTIGMLGLAFKPHTDDLRDTPAFDIGQRLIARGARVRAHDPVALERARREHSGLGITYLEDPEAVAADADALLLVTDWPQYLDLPWDRLAASMRTPLLLDGRNFLERGRLERAGFRYLAFGR